ncbi:hypothetical protein AX17_002366 [Amanita inopinata Kibby_2008]|nr:hypothetical protein AX17_002366 [Amanita inopinata Kibby_2008]
MFPSMPGTTHNVLQTSPSHMQHTEASNSPFPTRFHDRSTAGHEFGPAYFSYSPATPPSTSTMLSSDSFDYTFAIGNQIQEANGFGVSFQVPSALPLQSSAILEHSLDDHVWYYFAHVSKVQPMFAGSDLADMTCSLITQDPKGAVTNAVCALSSLHSAQLRISQGLELPESNRGHTKATYFRDEAYFQINSSRQLHGSYTDSDAIAALHLISFSQLSGGQSPWLDAFSVLSDWIIQTTLPSAEDPRIVYDNMRAIEQFIVKSTLWLDAFASLTKTHPPKFLGLMKRLLRKERSPWLSESKDIPRNSHMETFSRLPNEILLAIAETSALSHWKITEKNKGSLSYRELIRRSDIVEQLLGERPTATSGKVEGKQPTRVVQSAIDVGDEAQQLMIDVFREGVLLYLHTVLSDCNPGVPEIMKSVEAIVRCLYNLQPSDMDHSMVFPICIAACMTDDPGRREFLKSRLKMRESFVGNLMQISMIIELVWQRRDASGEAIDVRDVIEEMGLALLLV